MDALEHHLTTPINRDRTVAGGSTGTAGGVACGDVVRVSLRVDGDCIVDGGFEASGCPTMTAAASAALELVLNEPLLVAASVGATSISEELGGLSPGKFHAAELVADALHRALGAEARQNASVAEKEGRMLVAMSGGVDSAVAALLAMKDGREAVTVTLELWADTDNDGEASCCSADAVRLARTVAHRMGLPHFTLDLREEFRAGVVDPFLADHEAGLTPNPCVRCNGDVRLDEMLEFADRLGAPKLATGHYARHTEDGMLRMAEDLAKDQSYMLCGVSPQTLNRLYFPLGDLKKPEVRELAREADLSIADKRESQDLCFLAGTGKSAFLSNIGGLTEKTGPIINLQGETIGNHPGHHLFTVGQRKGLAVGGGEPLYVLAKDSVANTVTVGSRDDLATSTVLVRGAVLNSASTEVDSVKLRYRSKPVPCEIEGPHSPGRHARLTLNLAEVVYGVAPGQVACLLRGDVVIGWGTIGAQPVNHQVQDSRSH